MFSADYYQDFEQKETFEAEILICQAQDPVECEHYPDRANKQKMKNSHTIVSIDCHILFS